MIENPLKILFVTPYQPNLIRVRPFQLLRHLSNLGHKITLVYYDSPKDMVPGETLISLCEEIYYFPLTKLRALSNLLVALPSTKPLQAVYGFHPEMFKKIYHLLNQPTKPFDLIHIEHIRAAEFGRQLLKKYPEHNTPIVWDSVDSITYLFSQASKQHPRWLGRKFLGFETSRTALYEPETASLFNQVLVTSVKNSEIYQQLLSKQRLNANIYVVPNGVDLDYFSPGENIHRKPDTLVITGKMSYHANQKMVNQFVEKILPLIWYKNPNIKLEIVGQNPPQNIQNLAFDPRITVTGWVDDIRPYLQTATIAVAPLAYGAGIQNKILEAMACETPVIASTTALEALNTETGVNILASDNPQHFADLILELLDSIDRMQTIGKAGREYVEKFHSWNHVAEQLTSIYKSVMNK